MKYINDLIIYAVMALAVIFTIAMVLNLVGAVNVMRTLYRENDPLFWVMIAIYALLIVIGIVLYVRKRILSKNQGK